MKNHHVLLSRRRGVLLLIVLALLALFALIAVSFVVLTGQSRRSAEAMRSMEAYDVSPKQELERAFAQVVRGSNDPASVMGANSLLEDIYGNNAKLGEIDGIAQFFSTPSIISSPNGEKRTPLLEFTVNAPAAGSPVYSQFATAQPITNAPQECGGCVLTMLNGPAAGVSTRVVAVMPAYSAPHVGAGPAPAGGTRPARLQVLAKDELNYTNLATYLSAGGTLNYVVNGGPFSGSGFGMYNYNGSSQVPRPNLDGAGIAQSPLLPNSPFNRPSPQNIAFTAVGGTVPAPFHGPAGGANEDYDAPDFQNMLLAMVNPLAMRASAAGLPPTASTWGGTTVPIPSLHRAELCKYWQNNGAAVPPQYYCLRPLPSAHPNFNGGNPNFNPFWSGRLGDSTDTGQWDVDSDGDGIPDSIWVDLGMPVRPTGDGRLCKPLFAILCTDLDGRANLNAHGSLSQAQSDYYGTVAAASANPMTATLGLAGSWCSWLTTAPNASMYLRRGQGYGPAEINLATLFDSTINPSTGAVVRATPPNGAPTKSNANALWDYAQLLQGNGNWPLQQAPNRSDPWPGFPPNTAGAVQAPGFLPGRYGYGLPGVPYSAVPGVQYIHGASPQYLDNSSGVNPAGTYLVGGTLTGAFSPLMANRNWAYPPSDGGTWFEQSPLGAYGSPPDLVGAAAVGLDPTGRPLYWRMGQGYPWGGGTPAYVTPFTAALVGAPAAWHTNFFQLAVNTPYEFNLNLGNLNRNVTNYATRSDTAYAGGTVSAPQAPFSPGELERVLRPFDIDTPQLPARLSGMPGTVGLLGFPTQGLTWANSLALRGMVTTESWDLPTPAAVLPFQTGQNGGFVGNHVLDLLGVKSGLAGNTLLALGQQLLGPELSAGLRMDINRPLGPGRDQAGTGTTDVGILNTAGNAFTGNNVQGCYNSTATAVGTVVTSNNDNTNSPTSLDIRFVRQTFARNLYCLGLLLLDWNAMTQRYPTTSSDPVAPYRALAQWAVNVVDFRDRDSAMTRFDFDTNPFTSNGWNPKMDGTQTVFGCERPELLITETLAMHDRRTQDTAQEADPPPAPHVASTVGPPPNAKDKTGKAVPPPSNPPKATDPVPDSDYDQFLLPQGSLFVELFNPWPPYDNATTPYDAPDAGLRAWSGSSFLEAGVNLAQTSAETTTRGASGSPVWRLLICNYQSVQNLIIPTYGDIDRCQMIAAGSGTQAQSARNALASAIDRRVYFSPPTSDTQGLMSAANDPTITVNGATIKLPEIQYAYWNSLPVSTLLPGHYAVIGPAYSGTVSSVSTGACATFIGFAAGSLTGSPQTRQIDVVPMPTGADPSISASNQQFFVRNNAAANQDDLNSGAYKVNTNINAPMAVVVNHSTIYDTPASVSPSLGGAAGTRLPGAHGYLNASEPRDGYRLDLLDISGVSVSTDGYGTRSLKLGGGTVTIDMPFDELNHAGGGRLTKDTGPGETAAAAAVTKNGATPNYRIIYLQRLADPKLPYNGNFSATDQTSSKFPTYNPYLTVDSMPVDLYAFNGASSPTPANVAAPAQELGGKPTIATFQPVAGIQSRERGQTSLPNNPAAQNIWVQEPLPPTPPTPTWRTPNRPAGTGNVNVPFTHSLGYLNSKYGNGTPNASLNTYTPYRGFPGNNTIFPWLTWNNRPYVSPLELGLVPAVNSANLLGASTFTLFGSAGANGYANPQFYTAGGTATFHHLTNMLESAQNPPPSSPPSIAQTPVPQWHRLLEYLRVPSRFVGTDLQLWQAQMNLNNTNFPHNFYPPFNWVSNYRDPGRVNLNTVMDADVYRAVANDSFGVSMDTSGFGIPPVNQWYKIVWSRKGYQSKFSRTTPTNRPPATDAAVMNELLKIDPYMPSRFANPFRSYAGASLTPSILQYLPLQLFFNNQGVKAASQPSYYTVVGDEIEATLLRPDPDDLNSDHAIGKTYRYPLFRMRADPNSAGSPPTPASPSQTVPVAGSTSPPGPPYYCDPTRNPYFHLQELQRMQNLVTTRSNVYAVWITVGYFEVTPAPTAQGASAPDPTVYPDGYQLGQEVGTDTGDIKRHRAFFILDRSIPVGFSRGQDLNFDKAVLIRRFIE